MRGALPFGLVVLHLAITSPPLGAADREMVQPVDSRSNLVLEIAQGEARVEGRGMAPQRLKLRSDERLSTLIETRTGWTAAGVREKKDGAQLIVLERSHRGTRRLAVPDRQRHALRMRPSLAVQREELHGLAWLEGPDPLSLSVRAAARAGEEWQDVRIVAPPARGSQTGLVNTVLADGRWLLVWSAFDGRDDELLWSLGTRDDWSLPRTVGKGNTTPDIMPSLATTANGAVLAWSRLIEGHYRLMFARFQDGGWSRPEVVGPPGSLEPGFTSDGGELYLLYRHAWPQGWAVTELAGSRLGERLALFLDGDVSRPVLLGSSGEAVELRWPGRQQRSARWELVR